jgi:hypothetical protein
MRALEASITRQPALSGRAAGVAPPRRRPGDRPAPRVLRPPPLPAEPLCGARVRSRSALLPRERRALALERIHQIDERVLELERATQSGDANAVAAAIARALRPARAGAGARSAPDAPGFTKAALGLQSCSALETRRATASPRRTKSWVPTARSTRVARRVDKIDKTQPTKPDSTPSPDHTPPPHPTPDHSPSK